MASQSITIRTIEASKPCPGRDVYTWDSGLRGFGLRVTPKGVKSYVLQYRVDGGPARRTTIGIHGSPWTTQTARKEAERLLMLVRQGVDPVEEARNAKRREKVLNFSSYCDQFVELYLQANWPDTWPEQQRILENVLKPRWGKKALTALKRADMVKLMDDYADRPGSRKVIHSLLRKLFNWAVDREDIEISPLAGMKAPKACPSRRRVLGQEELICLWQATGQASWPWGPFARLLLLTMQRRQEVAEMDWSEINLEAKTWTLPAERAKNDEAHIIPLTEMAVAELAALYPQERGFVFSTTGTTPVSGYSKAKRLLDERMLKVMQRRQKERGGDPQSVKIDDWRLHDLRRTGATNLQALGIPIEVTEAVLNHISGTRAGIAGIYNRYKYEPEKRVALEAWDSRLQEMLNRGERPAVAQQAVDADQTRSTRISAMDWRTMLADPQVEVEIDQSSLLTNVNKKAMGS
ncbi:tyrosine-type recombinase/integrase [Sphingorhabdus sp.]|uniref:tyrosine-type recombinase/integrase n=1 Tax=Sphingorhabdus sp. TaxID=1902408 RepID=UPI0032B85FA0